MSTLRRFVCWLVGHRLPEDVPLRPNVDAWKRYCETPCPRCGGPWVMTP